MLVINKKYLSTFWQKADTYLLCKLKPLKLSRQWIFRICQTLSNKINYSFYVSLGMEPAQVLDKKF